MAPPLKALRKRLDLSAQDVAQLSGVSSTQVSKWERGWEAIPPEIVIELAIHYDVSASEVTGAEVPVEQWCASPYAISEAEPLYGTIRLKFFDGMELEYPIGVKAREAILSQLSGRSFMDSSENTGTEPWLYFWSLDDCIGFARLSCVHEVALVSDDERAAPRHFHPEVYRMACQFDTDGDEPAVVGERLQAGYNELVEMLGGEEIAHQRATHARLTYKDGRERFADCSTPNSAAPYFTLESASSEIPQGAFLQIEDMWDYHEGYFINMDALRMITLPAEAYHRATAPEEGDLILDANAQGVS